MPTIWLSNGPGMDLSCRTLFRNASRMPAQGREERVGLVRRRIEAADQPRDIAGAAIEQDGVALQPVEDRSREAQEDLVRLDRRERNDMGQIAQALGDAGGDGVRPAREA